jgi:hypothetical protein
MAKSKIDRIQVAIQTVIQTGADIGKATKFATSIGSSEQRGIEIVKVNYAIGDGLQHLSGVNSTVIIGLCAIEKNVPDPSVSDPAHLWPAGMLDAAYFIVPDDFSGTAESSMVYDVMHNFDDNPIIVHPNSLYACMNTRDAGGAMTGIVTIYFRYVDLSAEDYNDILQSFMLQNII